MREYTISEFKAHALAILKGIDQTGEGVLVTKRGRPVARLIPEPKPTPRKVEWPDIMARLKSYCGDVVLTDEDLKRMKDAEERSFL